MPHKLAKYVQAYTDNRGKHRYYFRRQGFVRVALPAPWDDGCLKAYETANTDKGPAGNPHTPGQAPLVPSSWPISLRLNIQGLASQTKAVYRRLLERLRKDAGDDRVQ